MGETRPAPGRMAFGPGLFKPTCGFSEATDKANNGFPRLMGMDAPKMAKRSLVHYAIDPRLFPECKKPNTAPSATESSRFDPLPGSENRRTITFDSLSDAKILLHEANPLRRGEESECPMSEAVIIINNDSARAYFSAFDVNLRRRNSSAKEYITCSAVLRAKFPSTRLAPRFDWG
jgi:hypothetical protein